MQNGDEKEVARVLSHHLNSHEYPSFQLSNRKVHDFFAEAKAFMRNDEAAFRLYESGSALECGGIMFGKLGFRPYVCYEQNAESPKDDHFIGCIVTVEDYKDTANFPEFP